MVEKFINTSISFGKEIKAFIPFKCKGHAFHCPEYIRKTLIVYENIKPY